MVTSAFGSPHSPTLVRVYWARLSSADVALRNLLTPSECRRVDTLIRPADQGRRLVGQALARAVLRKAWGEDRDELRHRPVSRDKAHDLVRFCPDCRRDDHGPVLVSSSVVPAEQWISVSHAGSIIAVAQADVPIGIDVEEDAAVMASALPEVATPTGNARAWVRREALIKVRDTVRAARLFLGEQRFAASSVEVVDLENPRAGYRAAVAVAAFPDDAAVTISYVNGDEILARYMGIAEGRQTR